MAEEPRTAGPQGRPAEYDGMQDIPQTAEAANGKKVEHLLAAGMPEEALHNLAFQTRMQVLTEELIRTDLLDEQRYSAAFEVTLGSYLDELKSAIDEVLRKEAEQNGK